MFITISVGPNNRLYEKLPAYLLCLHSEYFFTLLKGEFKEAHSPSLELLDEKEEVFELFNFYAVEGYLPPFLRFDDQQLQIPNPEMRAKQDLAYLTSAYAFGERRSARGFMNAVIDRIIRTWAHKWVFFDSETLDVIYAECYYTPLRRLAVDIMATSCDTKAHLQQNGDLWPADFAQDVFMKHMDRLDSESRLHAVGQHAWLNMSTCSYYVHAQQP